MQPLGNLTVVSLEQAVAAPFATRQLAELGARVIKVERPGVGDFARHYDTTVQGLASHFVWVNRSKQSLTLNLKTAEGQAILGKLLAQADVFIENLAPGAVERLGFDAKGLRQKYPWLIICNISGYGSSGPYRDKKAYDALVQAEAGLYSITGSEETPSKAGIAVADIAAGMYAYSGILSALLMRGQTHQGTVLEVSLFEALAEWMGYPAYYTMGGDAPKRTGADHPTIAPYGLFPTGDGGTLLLSIQNEREWVRFCAIVLEQPGVATDPRFVDNHSRVTAWSSLRQVIEAIFCQLPLVTIARRLDKAQIAYSQARNMKEFLDHPQLAARERWQQVDSPMGKVPALVPVVTMEGFTPAMRAIPEVGEHTEPILQELAYSAVEIAALRASGVV